MPTQSSIKRQNHRLHPCPKEQKSALLTHLITMYPNHSILIITKDESTEIPVSKSTGITVLTDAQLSETPEQKAEILISYDLPEKALTYIARLSRATKAALVIADAYDEKLLYNIETLLGRTIIQEVIEGFVPDFGLSEEKKIKAEKEAKKEFYRNQKAEGKKSKAPYNKSKENQDKRSSKPKFLGKDENGKAIFDGKTRERNHFHDGTPRTDEEKRNRTKFGSKPKFFKDSESSGEAKPKPKKEHRSEEKKPFGKKPSDKKSFDKKPFDPAKKPSDKKSFDKAKKPYPKQSENETRKPKPEAAPKRPPKRINVKSLKPKSKEQE